MPAKPRSCACCSTPVKHAVVRAWVYTDAPALRAGEAEGDVARLVAGDRRASGHSAWRGVHTDAAAGRGGEAEDGARRLLAADDEAARDGGDGRVAEELDEPARDRDHGEAAHRRSGAGGDEGPAGLDQDPSRGVRAGLTGPLVIAGLGAGVAHWLQLAVSGVVERAIDEDRCPGRARRRAPRAFLQPDIDARHQLVQARRAHDREAGHARQVRGQQIRKRTRCG